MVWKNKGQEAWLPVPSVPKLQSQARASPAAHPLPAQMETPGFPRRRRRQQHQDPAIIRPKVEPCEKEEEERSPPLPPLASDDREITPLSGEHPFFTTVMSKCQVQKQFQLVIPSRLHRHLPDARVPAALLCRGRSWAASYCGDLKCKKIDAAWRDFAVDNGLRVCDACVFELVTSPTAGTKGKVVFRVQVLRGGLPEEITSKGATAGEPLVIVD